MKKKVRKNTGTNNIGPEELKQTTKNLFMNTIIFLLAGLILVMGWSIYKKLTTTEVLAPSEVDNQVADEIIQVEVLNGCGVTGVANTFTDFLRSHNFDVVNVDNYQPFDIDETMVIDRIGNLANARKVAESLNVKTSKAYTQLNDAYFVDVTVIIGRDYSQLAPLN